MRVDRSAKGAALHATTSEAGGDRRDWLAVRGELGRVTLPERVLALPAGRKVVPDPEVAFAVEHRLAARAVAAAVELNRQHPGTGRESQVGHEGHGPQGV